MIMLRFCGVAAFLCVCRTAVAYPEPRFDPDPFGDDDFTGGSTQPLVLNRRHDSRERIEIGTLFVSGFGGKYNAHSGLLVDLTYHLSRRFAVGLSLGYADGRWSGLIDQVIAYRLADCDVGTEDSVCDLQPRLPALAQLTGSADVRVYWTPAYGRINLANEVDTRIEIYFFTGAGLHGQRTPRALVDRAQPEGFRVEGQSFGEGGFFANARARILLGTGLKVHLSDFVTLRSELMVVNSVDEFPAAGIAEQESSLETRYFFNNGLSFWLP